MSSMSRMWFVFALVSLVWCGIVPDSASGEAPGVLDIGNHRELFIDDYLIGEMKNVQLLVHAPVPQEIAVNCDKPWE